MLWIINGWEIRVSDDGIHLPYDAPIESQNYIDALKEARRFSELAEALNIAAHAGAFGPFLWQFFDNEKMKRCLELFDSLQSTGHRYPQLMHPFISALKEEYRMRIDVFARLERLSNGKNPHHGLVYLLSAGDLFKIGMTRSAIAERVSQIQPSVQEQISVVHLISSPYPYELEQALHIMFDHRREHGEWFRLNPDDVEYITSLEDQS